MSQYNKPPDLLRTIASLKTRIQALENTNHTQIYTTATLPSDVGEGTVVFVTDGGSGAQFQGWNGSAWVHLG